MEVNCEEERACCAHPLNCKREVHAETHGKRLPCLQAVFFGLRERETSAPNH